MKRRAISFILFFSFVLNVFYLLGVLGITFMQVELKAGLYPKAGADVINHFNFPTLYILFGVITLLMQLVMILSFSNSMRFARPTLWIEEVGCVMFIGFRAIYHYFPAMETRISQIAGTTALACHELLTEMIDKIDVLFALSSGLFLVGAGMTICFKKFVRYFIR